MKSFIALTLMSIALSATANDIVTNYKDKVLSTSSYTYTGKAQTVQNDDGKFSTSLERKLIDFNSDLKEDVELDLKNSGVLDSTTVTQVNDSLFYKKLKDENARDIIETAIVRQVISELKTINQTSKLKYKIKVANVKVNYDLDCKRKLLKRVCSATYSVETILNTVK